MGSELLSKRCGYSYVESEGFGGKCDGLIGTDFGTFAIRRSDYGTSVKGYICWSMVQQFES